MEGLASQSELLVLLIHSDVATTGYTAGTHTTSNYCCVRGHTTTNGQDTLGSLHTSDIFGRGLQTNQNNSLSSCMPFFCIFCGEYDLTTCSSGRSTKALADRSCSLQSSGVELRM